MVWSIFFFFLCISLSGINSAVYHIDQIEIPGHEGKCYDKNEKIFYNKGEIIKNEKKECSQRKCLGFFEETGKLRVEVLTCPVVLAGTGCVVKQNPEKPYPECCPQLVSMEPIDRKACKQKQIEK